MRTNRNGGVSVAWFLAALAVGIQSPAFCQSSPMMDLPNATPFAIAVLDPFPYAAADAVITRKTDREVRDVIFVRKQKVNPLTLASAVRQLAGIRAIYGNIPLANDTYRVTVDGRPWVRPAEALRWVSYIARHRKDKLEEIGDLPHIVLYLPNKGELSNPESR